MMKTKNKKIFTRLSAVLVTLLLVVAMSIPCFADGVVSDEEYVIKEITFTDLADFYTWSYANYTMIDSAYIVLDTYRYDLPDFYMAEFYDEQQNLYINALHSTGTRFSYLDYDNATVTNYVFVFLSSGIRNCEVNSYFSYELVGSFGSYNSFDYVDMVQFNPEVHVFYRDIVDTPSVEPEAGWYGQVKTIIKNAVFGENTLLNEAQQFTLDQISLWLTLVVILLPLIVGAVILVRCFR